MITAIKLLRLQIFRITQVISNFLSFIFKKNEIYRKEKSNTNAFYCLLLLLRRRRENDISPSLCKIAWSEDW